MSSVSGPRIGGPGPVGPSAPSAPGGQNVKVGGVECQCQSAAGAAVLSHGDDMAQLARDWLGIFDGQTRIK